MDVMTFLMKVLVYVHSLKKDENTDNVFISMKENTFTFIKDFLDSNTLSSLETSPVRETGTMRALFGIPVLTDKGIPDNTIVVKPTKKMFELK
jgi:hypothetical protein